MESDVLLTAPRIKLLGAAGWTTPVVTRRIGERGPCEPPFHAETAKQYCVWDINPVTV
jgi:hypothetical protein